MNLGEINKVGKPRIYKTASAFARAINKYFDSVTIKKPIIDYKTTIINNKIEDTPYFVKDDKGNQLYNVSWRKYPSKVAMCVYLGISRQTYKDYHEYKEYLDTINRAEEIILSRKLELLDESSNPRGVMFDLAVNYGMIEKKGTEHSGEVKQVIFSGDDELED